MRVVLDTNILVSGLIASAGTSAAILSAWRKGSNLIRREERIIS